MPAYPQQAHLFYNVKAYLPCNSMSSILEQLRQSHEDLENLKQLSAAALQSRSDPNNAHPRLKSLPVPLQDTRGAEQLVANLTSSARGIAKKLHSFYSTHPSLVDSNGDAMSTFYAALRELRDAHRSQATDTPIQSQRDATFLSSYRPVQFSGEEGGGRFLDLQQHFHQFINLTKNPALQYYEYIRDKLTCDDDVKPALKCSRPYEQYLLSIVTYLLNFAVRCHPLEQIEDYVRGIKEERRLSLEKELVSLAETYDSAESLMQEMGDEKVKTTLFQLALKCGGRPIERAQRLWSATQDRHYGQAALHYKVLCFLVDELLAEEKVATIANIEKKLSLSYKEIESERTSTEAGQENAHEDEDKEHIESTVYNPKDVPLGWDGKPIPYWMYKLHGLNHEFKCEVCGGATYKGPRAFERHFTENVHVGGLRRLGIAYSKAFMMITSIEDALQLQQRIVGGEKSIQFDSTREVEVEDEHGNVMNLKTYQDLKKQGLL